MKPELAFDNGIFLNIKQNLNGNSNLKIQKEVAVGLTSIYKRVKGKLEKTNGERIVSHKGKEKNLPSTEVFTDRH